MFKSMKGRLVAGVSLLAVAIVAASMSVAQAQDDEIDNGLQAIGVGTIEYDHAIEQFRETTKFMERLQEMEQEAMAARQAGDMQREMELGMEFQMRQQELVQSFESKLAAVMPEIARERNLHVIAMNVLYTDDEIDPKDITDEVIRKINELAEAEEDNEDAVADEPAE